MDEGFVKINGELHFLSRVINHEGKVLESTVTKRRNKPAVLKLFKTHYPQPIGVQHITSEK